MSSIASSGSKFGEVRLVEAPDETENEYRLDFGELSFLFDEVERQSNGDYYVFTVDGRTVGKVEAETVPDRVEGALWVLSGNQNS